MNEMLLATLKKKSGPPPGAWRQITLGSIHPGFVWNAGMVSVGDHIYIAGGNQGNYNFSGMLHKYDPVTNEMTRLATKSNGFEGKGLVHYDGKLHHFATYMTTGTPTTSKYSIYDIATNTWSNGPSIDSGMFASDASYVVEGEDVYKLGGGWNDSPNILFKFHVPSGTVTKPAVFSGVEAMQRGRGLAVYNGNGTIFAGMDQLNYLRSWVNVELSSNTVTRDNQAIKDPYNTRMNSAFIRKDNILWMFGGYNGDSTQAKRGKILTLDLDTKEVTLVETQGGPVANWQSAGCVLHKGKAYFYGGLVNTGINQMWEYTFG